LSKTSKTKLRLELDARNMLELMADADFAVSSAGSTCWEMCLLGLPAIIVDAAPNQVRLAQALHSAEAVIHIPKGDFTLERLTKELRSVVESVELQTNLSANASRFVDGCGAARVVSAMQSRAITIRPVKPEDCHLLWEWASDS